MKVTMQMVERGLAAWPGGDVRYPALPRLYFKAVLEAALADETEPVPGPFVLTAKEDRALCMLREGLTNVFMRRTLAELADRAVCTLAAPQVEALSLDEMAGKLQRAGYRLYAPAKTLGHIAYETANPNSLKYEFMRPESREVWEATAQAVADELVRRAEGHR